MRPGKAGKHVAAVLLLFGLFLGIPMAISPEILTILFGDTGVDAISTASLEIPEEPSGEFLVLMKTERHRDSLRDWEAFFRDEDFAVIFEDIQCITARGDIAAQDLAERYRIQLPENQMKVRSEDPVLLVSKIEAGAIDVAILSGEMAEQMKLMDRIDGVTAFSLENTGTEAAD